MVCATSGKPIGEPDSCALARRESAIHVVRTTWLTTRLQTAKFASSSRSTIFVVDRIARSKTSRRPSQKLPSTAIYWHLVAVKPLHPFQPLQSLRARRGRQASLGPGLRTASSGREELAGCGHPVRFVRRTRIRCNGRLHTAQDRGRQLNQLRAKR
jgi:hypothetical protein